MLSAHWIRFFLKNWLELITLKLNFRKNLHQSTLKCLSYSEYKITSSKPLLSPKTPTSIPMLLPSIVPVLDYSDSSWSPSCLQQMKEIIWSQEHLVIIRLKLSLPIFPIQATIAQKILFYLRNQRYQMKTCIFQDLTESSMLKSKKLSEKDYRKSYPVWNKYCVNPAVANSQIISLLILLLILVTSIKESRTSSGLALVLVPADIKSYYIFYNCLIIFC